MSENLLQKYSAVRFPPVSLGETVFTYELQSALFGSSESPILFKGYMEDVEKTQRGIVAEFHGYLGEDLFDKKIVRFRLTTGEANVKEFLRVKQETADSLAWLLGKPNYLVVARIDQVKKLRRYELRATGGWEDAEVEVELCPDFVATGELLEAVHIAND